MTTFPALGVSSWLCKTCKEMGIQRPTEIQKLTIPAIKKGHDVIARAKTGSGKTAAFGLPIIDELSGDPYGIFAYVLTPTRELAYQIGEQLNAFGANINIRCEIVVGGTDIVKEAGRLAKAPHIVIATPGRLAAHTRDGTELKLKHLKFLVLDEADRLFDSSFAEDLGSIFKSLPDPKKRQTLFFSATLTESITKRAKTLCAGNPKYLQVESSEEAHTVSQLKQSYVFLPQRLKETYLVYLLQEHKDKSVIVFTSTCNGCEIIAQVLTELEIDCESLHSRKNQARRLASLAKFRGGQSKVLVATDVAARGLDIPQVSLVLNYDVPRVCEDYVHRVGRTARAGRGGQAVTFVSQYDIKIFLEIEKHINVKVEEHEVPERKVLEYLKDVTNAKKMAKLRLEEFDVKDEAAALKRRKKRKQKRSGESSKRQKA
eukprot:CAMPEP_0114509220 /NCGR_PEP_ID=MMETSP0109-20121206/13080_1 /TAXON_ID=29199 /ORGANISM="Chlorarachnion reptans, Strain CCCM449" /LENGTH=429 /DNA_ID=CAMNT_0001688331 /DNA_START=116 /DNA_END=1405 /DNA_ORIENTATION=-